jgi:hypothetical protein
MFARLKSGLEPWTANDTEGVEDHKSQSAGCCTGRRDLNTSYPSWAWPADLQEHKVLWMKKLQEAFPTGTQDVIRVGDLGELV